MALTTTTGANAIREAYAPGFVEAVFRNHELLKYLPAPRLGQGDTAVRWKVNSAGQTPQVFTEGLAQPTAGEQTYVNAAVDWLYLRVMVTISGHVRDALGSSWFNAIDEEARLARKDLEDLLCTSLMGSTYGLEVAVDSTSSYAGISRGSAAYWESTETAVSGSLSFDDLIDLRETIIDNDKGGMPNLLLCPVNQASNIYRLTGQPFVAQAAPADKAAGLPVQTFAGMPIIPLPDWTNEVIMMLTASDGQFERVVQRPFTVDEMGKSGDQDTYQMSYAEALKVSSPKLHGKLTGVTA